MYSIIAIDECFGYNKESKKKKENIMDKIKKILAMIAVIIMAVCAVLTLIFALLTNFGAGDFTKAWQASAWCMVVIPVFIYGMLLIYRMLEGRGKR